MGLYLPEPSTVLVVDPDGGLSDLSDRLAERARERSEGSADPWTGTPDPEVETVESAAAALDRLATGEVACLVVGDVDDPAALVIGARNHDPDLPVLYVPGSAEGSVVADVAAAGGRYLPGELDGERLADVVFDALDRYRERWRRAEATGILETMLSDLEVALYAKDEDARHVMMADVPGGANPEAAAGKTDAELYGDPRDPDAEATQSDDERVIQTGEPIYRKEEAHGEPPAEHWSRTTKVPWTDDDGQVKGLVGISVDISGMKHTERELAAQNDRLERFADYVSHDLKNPLQVAMGYVGAARGGEHDAELAKAEDALDRMDEMLDDLRHTVTAGGVPDDEARESPLARLDDLVADVWAAIETGDATLELAFDGPVTVAASESALRPLLENLLKNAVEHGGADVAVRVGPLPDGFFVADDGPGVPEDERDEVFEEGYTTARSGSGTGLALVAEVADERDWDLALTESAAGGARFEFHNVPVAGQARDVRSEPATCDLDEAADVGDVSTGDRGRYDADTDRWVVECDGEDIWRGVNDFHFVFARVTGDVRIQARLADFEHPDEYSKAGVMVRADTAEDSPYGYVGRTGEWGTELLWRDRRGADGRSQQLVEDDPFEYYRVDRVGDELACAASRDGRRWRTLDQRPADLEETACVGLAVCSAVPRSPATAVFDNVTVTELARER